MTAVHDGDADGMTGGYIYIYIIIYSCALLPADPKAFHACLPACLSARLPGCLPACLPTRLLTCLPCLSSALSIVATFN